MTMMMVDAVAADDDDAVRDADQNPHVTPPCPPFLLPISAPITSPCARQHNIVGCYTSCKHICTHFQAHGTNVANTIHPQPSLAEKAKDIDFYQR